MVLGHVVSAKGIEVHKAKVDIIQSLASKLLEKSDSLKGNLNFIADLSKPFLKLLHLYAIYLLKMLVFTLIKII